MFTILLTLFCDFQYSQFYLYNRVGFEFIIYTLNKWVPTIKGPPYRSSLHLRPNAITMQFMLPLLLLLLAAAAAAGATALRADDQAHDKILDRPTQHMTKKQWRCWGISLGEYFFGPDFFRSFVPYKFNVYSTLPGWSAGNGTEIR